MAETRAILERLVAFPTVSLKPNLDLVEYVRALLEGAGIACRLVHCSDGTRASILASTGPLDKPGVILSGHTDVVPVSGQQWASNPFSIRQRDGRLYGRGTADMKGFVAGAIGAMIAAAKRDLKVPLHLALSYDEEIGCVGVRGLLDVMKSALPTQRLCLVGEPTAMRPAIGHKGKLTLRAVCCGLAGHSSMAPRLLNAIHLGCDFVAALRAEQRRLQHEGARDPYFDIDHSTIHVGRFTAGTALNIVPEVCEIEFEIRNLATEDAEAILARLKKAASRIVEMASSCFPTAAIELLELNAYPGLDTAVDHPAVDFVGELTGESRPIKVAYGTEGGLFHDRLGVATVICGPGSMDQGHKADEFVCIDQLARCDAMLATLVTHLETGEGLPALGHVRYETQVDMQR